MLFGKHIGRYYLRYLPMLLFGVFALICVDYFQLEIPVIYRTLIDGMDNGILTERGMDFILEDICRPMILIIAVLVTGRFLWRICFFGSARLVEADLRRRMFDHSVTLPVSFYHKNKVGALMSLYTNDIETVQECFGSGVMMFFDALLLGVLALRKMFTMDKRLTLLALIPMTLLLVIGTVVGKYMKQKWADRQEAYASLSDFAQESFSGISVIKAFVKETLELLAFHRRNRHNEETNVIYTRASTLLSISVTLFVESVICIILGYGGYLVHENIFTAGELIEFIGYFNTIVWPVMAVSQMIEMQSRGKASLARIGELLDRKTDIVDAEDAIAAENIQGEITFRSLSFAYPDTEREVLKELSFSIRAGERIGIIGKTGAGKTTVADLLLRAYPLDPAHGSILLDGRPLDAYTVASVRAAIAYVPQDNFLFSDTVAENIAFSLDKNLPRDREAIREAARLADVDSNISAFSDGYDTMLGERGVTVSGGQKQRISIARALLKNAPVLILDDALSAVDTETERAILDGLAAARAGKTTIFIAHRISTVKDLDRILVLDEGRLIAYGSHEELLVTSPEYRDMVELQKLEEVR